MQLHFSTKCILGLGAITLMSSCYHPPYNNFKPYNQPAAKAAQEGPVGSVVGMMATGTLTGTLIGGGVGGVVGGLTGLYKESKPAIIKKLSKQDIQFVEYGDTMTLIVPTDKYFMFMSPRIKEICYPGLNNIVRLLKLYPKSPVYVAAFTDNVGSFTHKMKSSEAQAETMMTFLWSNGIKAIQLHPQGYADRDPISSNKIIHSSAQNRRIEIQFFTGIVAQNPAPILYQK